jgi:hypothetical protein
MSQITTDAIVPISYTETHLFLPSHFILKTAFRSVYTDCTFVIDQLHWTKRLLHRHHTKCFWAI